jgi:hypothetical protein
MPDELSKILIVYLIDLMSRGGSILLKDFKNPELDANKKRELIRHNLIAETKVPKEKSKALLNNISITDEGWAFLENYMDFPQQSGSKSVSLIFSRLMQRLSTGLPENISIKSIFSSIPIPKTTVSPKQPTEQLNADKLHNHIRMIHKEKKQLLMPGGGLRVANLLKSLPDNFDLQTLRKLLLELQNRESLVLYRFDDPSMVKDEDKKAELFVAGEPRHYLFLK